MIKIPINMLSSEWMKFDGEEPVTLLDIEPTELLRFEHPVEYHLRASLVSGGVLLEGTVETQMQAQCGRCLENFTTLLKVSDICHFYEKVEDPELDVTEDVREDLVIAIPPNPVCDDECEGLCPSCGANKNKQKCQCAPPERENDSWGELDNLKFEK